MSLFQFKVWIVIGCDEPSKHKKIDPAEQKFIEAAIPKSNHVILAHLYMS